jgi:hypothetical protein
VVGSIEGVYDFDVHRTTKSYVRLVVPLEYRDKVAFGKVHRFQLKSIEEIQLNERQREIAAHSVGLQYRPLMYRLKRAKEDQGRCETATTDALGIDNVNDTKAPAIECWENVGALFTVTARLHTKVGDRRYFRLPDAAFERETGLGLEKMNDYVTRGEVEGVGEFKKVLERYAARQDIPIYLSPELSKSVEVGKEYVVGVDKIERTARRPSPWEGIRIEGAKPWSWEEVGSWVDTEGAICSRKEKTDNYQILISQKERNVLAEIAQFSRPAGTAVLLAAQ